MIVFRKLLKFFSKSSSVASPTIGRDVLDQSATSFPRLRSPHSYSTCCSPDLIEYPILSASSSANSSVAASPSKSDPFKSPRLLLFDETSVDLYPSDMTLTQNQIDSFYLTFSDWPDDAIKDAHELASAGFTYTGKYTICLYIYIVSYEC